MEFKSSANQRGGHFLRIGRRVSYDEVLSTRFTNDAGVGAVFFDVVSDFFPQLSENTGGSREVETGEVFVFENHVSGRRTIYGNEVDNAVGEACLAEDFHDDVSRIHLGVGRFPQADVAHQCRGGGQVSGDRREVERRDAEHESFQGAVLQAVPNAGRAFGLYREDLLHVVGVESEEIGEFTHRVDFRLESVFALSDHGRRVHFVSVGTGEQIGRFQEDRRALFVGHARPRFLCVESRFDGVFHVFLRAVRKVTHHFRLVVRGVNGLFVVRAHFLPVDDHRNVDGFLIDQRVISLFQSFAFGCTRSVIVYGLVFRERDLINSFRHDLQGVGSETINSCGAKVGIRGRFPAKGKGDERGRVALKWLTPGRKSSGGIEPSRRRNPR